MDVEKIKTVLDKIREQLKFDGGDVELISIDPEGTYIAWLDFRKLGMDVESLSKFMLKKAKVALENGKIFGPRGEGFQRINVSCPKSLLKECMTRIVTALKEEFQ